MVILFFFFEKFVGNTDSECVIFLYLTAEIRITAKFLFFYLQTSTQCNTNVNLGSISSSEFTYLTPVVHL